MKQIQERPNQDEYTEAYGKYIQLVPTGDLLDILRRQEEETLQVFTGLSEEQSLYRYAPDKWSLKEILGHLLDNERVMIYRLVRISRKDESTLSGFDQDLFVQESGFDRVPLELLLEDYRAVRASTLTLLRTLDAERLQRQGVANNSKLSVLALACIVAGHERHHLNVMGERYRQA